MAAARKPFIRSSSSQVSLAAFAWHLAWVACTLNLCQRHLYETIQSTLRLRPFSHTADGTRTWLLAAACLSIRAKLGLEDQMSPQAIMVLQGMQPSPTACRRNRRYIVLAPSPSPPSNWKGRAWLIESTYGVIFTLLHTLDTTRLLAHSPS